MRRILFAETTLDGENTLSFKEKLKTAKLLDNLNTDIICVCNVKTDKASELLVKNIASQTENSIISCPVYDSDVQAAYNCICKAKKKRLNIKLPVSVAQMEYHAHIKPPKLLEKIKETVLKAKEICEDVEFTALDATRAEKEFLIAALKEAVNAGAGTVTISDDEGNMLPDEFFEFVSEIKSACEFDESIHLGVSVSDTLSMSEACAYEAIKAGCDTVYVTSDGIARPDFKILASLIVSKGEKLGLDLGINMTLISRNTEIINSLADKHEKSTYSVSEAKANGGAVIDAGSDINVLADTVKSLGYELAGEDIARVYERVSAMTGKKSISEKELDAIIASVALQVPQTYVLKSFVVNSGNIITATAHVVLERNGEKVEGISTGDGPIDAAFMAIEKLIGHHYELDDFEISSVTEGKDAMGEALVKLRDGGVLYSGRGISTDIVGASIRAYISALNKIVFR